ncbi:MAG: hypothetical protein Q8L29_00695 [archaeon]|nr:hypothetical protein [archaeon]
MKLIDKENLLKEAREKFESIKNELGFKSTFEEINDTFYINDYILSLGFVSERFSRQICGRIVENYMSWLNYLQGLVFPNAGNIVNLNESKLINDSEKKEIGKMLSEIMAIITTNSVVAITKDKKIEARFIDESVTYWNSSFKSRATQIIKKINDGWKK